MPLNRLNRFKRPSFGTWPFKEELVFPRGLHGFESLTRFFLVGYQNEAPYLRLISQQNPAISFVVVDPFPLHPTYEPLITQHDLGELKVLGDTELILLTIVNTKEKPFTINLGAPLLIHWHRKQGRQVLFPENWAFPLN